MITTRIVYHKGFLSLARVLKNSRSLPECEYKQFVISVRLKFAISNFRVIVSVYKKSSQGVQTLVWTSKINLGLRTK
jgi:ribosomal protein S8